MLINIWRVGVRRMRPDSFQWCPVTGQGAMGTNWSTGSSIWTWGTTSSLWGWRSTGTGCPGRLWSLLLRKYSRPAWTRSCAACCRRPSFGRGVGLDGPQRTLPTATILWFCDSVKGKRLLTRTKFLNSTEMGKQQVVQCHRLGIIQIDNTVYTLCRALDTNYLCTSWNE